MTHLNLKHTLLMVATAGLIVTTVYAAQTPAPGAAQTPPAGGAAAAGGRGGGRGGGLPGATPEQTQAVMDMNAALASPMAATAAARAELGTVALADVKNVAGIAAATEKLRAAELALATARGAAFAQLQAGPNKLNSEQVTALIAAGGNVQGGRGGGGGGAGGAGRGRGN